MLQIGEFIQIHYVDLLAKVFFSCNHELYLFSSARWGLHISWIRGIHTLHLRDIIVFARSHSVADIYIGLLGDCRYGADGKYVMIIYIYLLYFQDETKAFEKVVNLTHFHYK